MLRQTLVELYERDVNLLKNEISLYKSEDSIWKIREGISNSAANLALHIVGNLNHFVGAGLGNTGYVRNRDAEFSTKNVPQKQLVAELDKTAAMVKNTLSKLSDADLDKDFPFQVGGHTAKTGYALIFFLAHLNYHLGQVNYHRRLVG